MNSPLLMLLRSFRAPLLALALACGFALPAQPQSLKIIEAVYGAGTFQMNVTPTVRGLVRDNTLDIAADPGILGGDPAPGQGKRLRIVYRYNGVIGEASAADFERVRLPAAVSKPPLQQQQSTVPAPAATPGASGGNWAGGALPAANQPAPASPGGFSIGDLFGDKPALRIVAARYGADTRYHDVRDRLQGLVKGEALSVKVDNASMGGDPAVAKAKSLEVTYEFRGATYQVAAKEGVTLNLPDPNARTVVAPTAPSAPAAVATAPVLRIVSARYGADTRFNDVRDRLQALVRDNSSLAVKVDNASMGGDPAVAKDKTLEVLYEWNGQAYRATAREGRTLNLPDSSAQVVGSGAAAAPAATAPTPSVRGADSGAARSAGNRNLAAPVASTAQVAPLGNTGGLRIFYARYAAADGREADIRERLRPLLQNDTLRVTIGADTLGDPAPGAAKVATILYEFKGRTYEKSARDGETIQLP